MDKVNILMVDDQPGKLLAYEAILGGLGENLIKADSGRAALECLLKTDIAVVLLDVGMPELDGFEVAEMIRQHPRFQRTAIIFVTAERLSDDDRMNGYRRGAVDYVSVPIDPEVLRAKVSVFAELHRKSLQLERLNRELRKLSTRLMTLQDDERRRIARELHEGLGQELVAAKMMVDGMNPRGDSIPKREETQTRLSAMLDGSIRQIRGLSQLLHPPMLEELGLCSAINWYVTEWAKLSGVKTSLHIAPRDFPRLDREIEIATFRIVQEALTNVARHSKANQASVALVLGGSQLTISVRDDGKGIGDSSPEAGNNRPGVGIVAMRQRAKELGGELLLQDLAPGTLLEVLLPGKWQSPQEKLLPSAT
jgi:signal transduction histidine kinase